MTQTRFLPSILMIAVLLVADSCAESRGWKNDRAGARAVPRHYSCDDIWLVLHREGIAPAVSAENASTGVSRENDDHAFMPQAQAEIPGHDGAPDIRSFIDLNDAMGLDAVASAILLRILKVF